MLGDRAQGVVAGGMTESVVDLFEVVNVDHQCGKRLAHALGTLPFLGEHIVHGVAVEETGQAVVARSAAQLSAQLDDDQAKQRQLEAQRQQHPQHGRGQADGGARNAGLNQSLGLQQREHSTVGQHHGT